MNEIANNFLTQHNSLTFSISQMIDCIKRLKNRILHEPNKNKFRLENSSKGVIMHK
jgi:hypothetical protein